jgi:hypothetical protein
VVILSDSDIIDTRIEISMNSSTSFMECDRLFLRDFFRLDKRVAEHIKSKDSVVASILS